MRVTPWEYSFLNFPNSDKETNHEESLDGMGLQGWELVSVNWDSNETLYTFKRPRSYSAALEDVKDEVCRTILDLLLESGKDEAIKRLKARVRPGPDATREDLISGGGTEREKELFQIGYEWGLSNREKILDYTK